ERELLADGPHRPAGGLARVVPALERHDERRVLAKAPDVTGLGHPPRIGAPGRLSWAVVSESTKSRRMPAAVLWDMDGTLVDTEPYWLTAETELVRTWGGEWTTEDGLQLVGQGLEHSARILQSRGVDLDVDEIVDTLTDRVLAQVRESVPWRPGSRELLQELRDAGIPTALVTMSIGRMAHAIVDALGFAGFDLVVA